MYKDITPRGFIKTIILIIIALALLKFVFNFDIIDFLKRPDVVEWFSKVWNFVNDLWDRFIARLFWFAWDNLKILLSHAWTAITGFLDILNKFVDKMPAQN